eukprot:Awhi_evm1s10877
MSASVSAGVASRALVVSSSAAPSSTTISSVVPELSSPSFFLSLDVSIDSKRVASSSSLTATHLSVALITITEVLAVVNSE